MNSKISVRRRIGLSVRQKFSIRIVQFAQILLNILITNEAAAITRTSVTSGNWNVASNWAPEGVPTSGDDIFIAANDSISLDANGQSHTLTILSTAKFIGTADMTLNISGNLVVNGIADMNGCNIVLMESGAEFKTGAGSLFTWAPGDNTSAGASLFTNGVENFDPSSKIIIKRWYDYSVPLGQVMTGDFGDIVINTPGGNNSIVEWDQKNQFEAHRINGTLTIDQGWLTLDKTGSISSTTIGNIVLTSVNSVFYAHNGTHPSSFTLTTGSVTNNGGKFYGISDGNGNINLHVTGDVNNTGNIKIINNSGFSGVSNGNVSVQIDGDFIQSSGDTRFIYNITTTNSGTYQATIKDLLLTGGIFMGQNGVHGAGHTNVLNIIRDLSVNFSKSTDKFRGTGLTSIGSAINNAGFTLNVGRDLITDGTTQAEFTTSASSGNETLNVSRDMIMRGCTSSMNYGTLQASHPLSISVSGNLFIAGGSCCLSRNNGTMNVTIGKNLQITSGTLVLKGNTGQGSMTVNGSFDQSSGTLLLHSNTTTVTNDIVQIQFNGNFSQRGGILNFDDNVTGAQHVITLNGDSCLFIGNGSITHAGAGTSNSFGLMNYNKNGKVIYTCTDNIHIFDQVIQSINDKSEVIVRNGTIKTASHSSSTLYLFKISCGGKLTLNNATLSPNGTHSISKLYIDSTASLSLTNEDGFFGNTHSAIGTGINYSLHSASIIEYNGERTQTITGLLNGPIQQEKKYGILRINNRSKKIAAITNDKVFVRNRLELLQGSIDLVHHTMTIENGNTDAIMSTNGFIESDVNKDTVQNTVCWKNMSNGIHVFPFGRYPFIYLPVRFNLINGSGKDVSISTRRTEKDNLPYPAGTSKLSTTELFEQKMALDRWWDIMANGVRGDVTFTYSSDERTISPEQLSISYGAMEWNGTSWTVLKSTDKGMIKNTRAVSFTNITNWSHFVLVPESPSHNTGIESFDVTRKENENLLKWELLAEKAATTMTIEKSLDGINFYDIGVIKNENIGDENGFSSFTDKDSPQEGIYYRIRMTGEDNIPTYSELKEIKTQQKNNSEVRINSVGPNPFSSTIKVQYTGPSDALLEIIDQQGRKIMEIPAENRPDEKGYVILNLEHLKKGIYFLTITSDSNKDAIKIIKNE